MVFKKVRSFLEPEDAEIPRFLIKSSARALLTA